MPASGQGTSMPATLNVTLGCRVCRKRRGCKERYGEFSNGKRLYARAADRLLAERIAREKFVIIAYGTGCGNGGWHRGEPSEPVKSVYQEMKQAFTLYSAALGKRDVFNMRTIDRGAVSVLPKVHRGCIHRRRKWRAKRRSHLPPVLEMS